MKKERKDLSANVGRTSSLRSLPQLERKKDNAFKSGRELLGSQRILRSQSLSYNTSDLVRPSINAKDAKMEGSAKMLSATLNRTAEDVDIDINDSATNLEDDIKGKPNRLQPTKRRILHSTSFSDFEIESVSSSEVAEHCTRVPDLPSFKDLKINAISPIIIQESIDSNHPNSGQSDKNFNAKKSILESNGFYNAGAAYHKANSDIGKLFGWYDENAGDLGNGIINSNSGSEENSRGNWKTYKHQIIYASLISLIIILVCAFVPAICILSRGTSASVRSFFNTRSVEQRQALLSDLETKFGANVSTKIINYDRYVERISNVGQKEGSKLNGKNTVEGLSENYKYDDEVVALMTNSEIPGTVFYGLAYSPRNAMAPKCGITKRDILLDLSLMSTVTTRIRNYGTQCNQSELILDSIQDLNLNMTLAMGIWIGSDDRVNEQQVNTMKNLLKKYPRRLFESIFIGNEVLFREEKSVSQLLKYIRSTKSFLQEIGYDDIPVGTSEIGSLITEELADGCDIIGANVHPFFGGESVKKSSDWTFDFLKYQVEPIANKTKIAITEVGWPSGGGKYKNAVADSKSFELFLNEFICEAYENVYGWYFFEAFDEPWKNIFYEDNNKWETEWGIFTNDRKLKIQNFPLC